MQLFMIKLHIKSVSKRIVIKNSLEKQLGYLMNKTRGQLWEF